VLFPFRRRIRYRHAAALIADKIPSE